MAKKKENEFSIMQAPLPKGQKSSRLVKVDWSGLNYRQSTDTGDLSFEKNISTDDAPYLTPSGQFEVFHDFGEVPHMEYNPVSEQGDFSTENGVVYNKDKTRLIFVPKSYTGKLIIPETVSSISGWFSSRNNLTELVIQKNSCYDYAFIDTALYSCTNLKTITFASGVTTIPEYVLYHSTQNYNYLQKIRIPKSVTRIQCRSIPIDHQVSVYYEGSKDDWDKITKGGNKYWSLNDASIVFNASYDDVLTDSGTHPEYSSDEAENAEYFTISDNGELMSYTGSKTQIKVPAKIGETVVKSIHSEFSSAADITHISIPSTLMSLSNEYSGGLANITSLVSVSFYTSDTITKQDPYSVGDKKGLKIYGYKSLLATNYYIPASLNAIYSGKIAFGLLDSMGENIKIDNKDYAYISDTVFLEDENNCSIAAFSAHTGTNIATVNKVQSEDKLLFFPGNYSQNQTVIEDTVYRYEYRGYLKTAIYPWAFINDFTDKKKIYNVVEKSGGNQIPTVEEINNKNYLYYTPSGSDYSYYMTRNTILGLWIYNEEKQGWIPHGYDRNTDKKTAFGAEEVTAFSTTENVCPVFNDVTVFQSRLFGIDKLKIYASEFGNYCGWNLDTADSSGTANAWISLLSANPAASGELTAITTYQDRVIVFRENYMYEIRNTKNPFRVVDIFGEGCIGKEALSVVGDRLIFISKNGVKLYTGAKPQEIGMNLNADNYKYAATGSDGRRLYLYCQTDKSLHNLFVYDTLYGQWSQMDIDQRVLCFTSNDNDLFMLCEDNKIYKLNTKNFQHDWAAETDFQINRTIDIKHIKKIQILAELAPESNIRVYVTYDGAELDKTRDLVYSFDNAFDDTKKLPIRILPRKSACMGYKIRLEGYGYAKIYQMELLVTGGGELFNDNV